MSIKEKAGMQKSKGARYMLFAIRWIWHNREWANTRQKWKAMERAWEGR